MKISIVYLNCTHVLDTINFHTFKEQSWITSQYEK